jgi:hypothetical protein
MDIGVLAAMTTRSTGFWARIELDVGWNISPPSSGSRKIRTKKLAGGTLREIRLAWYKAVQA